MVFKLWPGLSKIGATQALRKSNLVPLPLDYLVLKSYMKRKIKLLRQYLQLFGNALMCILLVPKINSDNK